MTKQQKLERDAAKYRWLCKNVLPTLDEDSPVVGREPGDGLRMWDVAVIDLGNVSGDFAGDFDRAVTATMKQEQ